MHVNWASIDALRIVKAGESSGPAIVWIGVEPKSLSFEEGSAVVLKCRTLIDSFGLRDSDYQVEIRESRVMRQAGKRFLDSAHFSNPTFTARDPYTATLGIPLSAKDRPWTEGTGGFYISAEGDDKDIYLVTARRVVLPLDGDHNMEYECEDESTACEDVVVLGTSAFDEKLAAIEYEIHGQEFAITDAEERIQLVKDADDSKLVEEREGAEEDGWRRSNVSSGSSPGLPTIVFSTEPGGYTLDLVIKVDAGTLDSRNYRGNSINIGTKYTRQEFTDKVSPSFKFPANRLATLQGQVPENALGSPPSVLDANGDPCLIVFKNGAKTGLTIGKANNVSSHTRNHFAGWYHESREWPVIPFDKNSWVPFSAQGDSGACVADDHSRVGGIVTGGSGATVLQSTERFKHAHLNPVLA